MLKIKKLVLLLFLIALAITAICSCPSAEPVYSENMLPEDYFQLAQDRAERGDYKTAIAIYYKMKETFPDNLEKNIWASYEIAFLYHKLGDDPTCLRLLDELLTLYAQDTNKLLPTAPKKLAEILRDNIVNKDQYNNKVAKISK